MFARFCLALFLVLSEFLLVPGELKDIVEPPEAELWEKTWSTFARAFMKHRDTVEVILAEL